VVVQGGRRCLSVGVRGSGHRWGGHAGSRRLVAWWCGHTSPLV
jgi:hypothetical protein